MKPVLCPQTRLNVQLGEKVNIVVLSDVHLGAKYCNKKKLAESIAYAKDNNSRIIIMGDLLDLILPKDVKRFDPSQIDPDIVGLPSQIDGVIEMAYEYLSPVKNQIDFVLTGNHEAEVEKRHSINPINHLFNLLYGIGRNEEAPYYMGYDGFFRYVLEDGNGLSRSFDIYARHGSTGAAPMTEGSLELKRVLMNYRADAILAGHNHCSNTSVNTVQGVSQSGYIYRKNVYLMRCGTFLDSPLDSDGLSGISYSRKGGYAPSVIGALEFDLFLTRSNGNPEMNINITMKGRM